MNNYYVVLSMTRVNDTKLMIDTGDTAWYVMVAIKRFLLNNCLRYIVMLKRI